MPLNRIAKLEAKLDTMKEFRTLLADVPTSLARCEAHEKMFQTMKGKLYDLVPKVYELNGIKGGLELSVPLVGQQKTIIKAELDKGELPNGGTDETDATAIARGQIARIAAAQKTVLDVVEKQKGEVAKARGVFDGFAAAAEESIKEIDAIVTLHRRHLRVEEEEAAERKKNPPAKRKRAKKTTKRKTTKKGNSR
jgi:hypothetical protein